MGNGEVATSLSDGSYFGEICLLTNARFFSGLILSSPFCFISLSLTNGWYTALSHLFLSHSISLYRIWSHLMWSRLISNSTSFYLTYPISRRVASVRAETYCNVFSLQVQMIIFIIIHTVDILVRERHSQNLLNQYLGWPLQCRPRELSIHAAHHGECGCRKVVDYHSYLGISKSTMFVCSPLGANFQQEFVSFRTGRLYIVQ